MPIKTFEIEGRDAFIIQSSAPAPENPWVWYAPTITNLPNKDLVWYFNQLLEKGISIGGIHLGEVRGSPESSEKFSGFYDTMVSMGYSSRPVLLGQSRGGLMMLAWAMRNPDKVRAFAGIYPVCNLESWPLKNSEAVLKDYGITEEELLKNLSEFNPIDNLQGLLLEKVPLFIVHGDSDILVPYEENGKILRERYEAGGGSVTIKIIEGEGHTVTPSFFECRELIDFISGAARENHPVEIFVDPIPLKEPAGMEKDLIIEVSGAGPLRRLSDAQDSVRRLIKAGAKGSITVMIREGIYRENKEIEFRPEDSGHPWLRIVWKAYPGEDVVISGSREITDWKKVKAMPPGTNPLAKGHLWVYRVPEGECVTTLYKGDSLLRRARSAPLLTVPSALRSNTSLHVLRENLPVTENPSEMELIWRRTYYMNYLPVQSVDYNTCVITVSQPATYSFNYNNPGEFWIENAIELINSPGEWAFVKGNIYYWPEKKDQKPGSDIHYPVAENIIGLYGDIDSPNYIQNMMFDGFILKHGKRMSWHTARVGVQHDWDVYDRGWAGFYLRGVQNCTIQNSTIKATGGNGIKLGIHCTNNTICNNHIHNLGGNGISLVGYGPGKRDETHHNLIKSNHIHHIGTLWDASLGILICQAGNNHVTNNKIHDLKYTGIALVGGRSGIFYQRGREEPNDGIGYTRWEEIPEAVKEGEWWHQIGFCHTRNNLIDYNDISNILLEREDGNGIYLSGIGTGNILEYNFLHDMDETTNLDAAIRFDDTNWYNTARFNVMVNVKTGFTLKCVNNIENNIIYGYSLRGVRIATTTQVNTTSYGANVVRNIIVSNKQGIASGLTMVTTHMDRNPTIMEEPTLENNVYFDISSPDAAKNQLREFQDRYHHDMHSIAADPCFHDPANSDYSLRPESPARRLGILSIEKYGLQEAVGPLR